MTIGHCANMSFRQGLPWIVRELSIPGHFSRVARENAERLKLQRSFCRSSLRRILPEAVFGTASTKCTSRGCL